jgi:putative intracellular protease/amidase
MFQDDSSVSFVKTKEAVWKNTTKLSTFLGRSGEFAAIFYPGGHGPMYDLAVDQDSIALIREFHDAGKTVAAVCHGPAALVNVKLADGSYLLKGKTATGFTNQEEDQVNMSKFMPFMLEDKMKEAGAVYKKTEPWGELVLSIDGGKFITGQNPGSARGVGEAIAKAIGV